MEIGISTATLFGREYNEDALVTLDKMGARVCEVFLETYCEYTEEYGKLLASRKGGLLVHSVHTLNTHFEPQLFAVNDRARNDALNIFRDCLKVGKLLGASYYTMHGKAHFKPDMRFDNYAEIGAYMRNCTELAKEYSMEVCLENVSWAYYAKPGFFTQVKKYCPDLRSCFDIKQARQSGFPWEAFVEETGADLKTVHLSDVDENGRTALPSEKGKFDFSLLFKKLASNGFEGNCLLEVYKDNFSSYDDLKRSLEYLRDLKDKYFRS